jgi:opacity protein-like surface antigen
MKKLALAALLGLALMSTTASADAAKGKRVYQKFMKDSCGKTGGAVAGKHTQKEWKKLQAGGKFKAELEKICPTTKTFLDGGKFKKLQGSLYDFMYEFGKGSGNIPAC